MSTLPHGTPGTRAPVSGADIADLFYGTQAQLITKSVVISSTARDAGSSPTTHLRAGLVMGQITATQEYKEYDPTATDGSEVAAGILWQSVPLSDALTLTAYDRLAPLVIAGAVKGGRLIGLDSQARAHLHARFIFDDDLAGNTHGWTRTVAKTTNYTVTISDRNTTFTNQGAGGAVTFTLPEPAKGLKYRFFCEADQTLTVAATTAGTLVAFNDAAANSVSLGTAGEKVGGAFEVIANADGTKWLVFPLLYSDVGGAAQTVTVTT